MQQPPGTIALTGGTGFIGRHLIDALLRDGWYVNALIRQPNALPKHGNLRQVTGVLEDPSALRKLVAGSDAIVHAGGRIAGRKLAEFESTNVLGTQNLIEAAVDQPIPPRIIYVSSIAAREPSLSHYASTKRQGEILFEKQADGLNWQIIRPPVVYGPGDKQTLKLFRQFKCGYAILPPAGGRFSMLFVSDLIAAVQHILQNSPQISAIFELDDGHENGYSWNDVLTEAGSKFGRKVNKIILPVSLLYLVAASATAIAAVTGNSPILSRGKINEFTHPDWVATNNLLNKSCAWQSNINLRDGISSTIDWYVAQGWL